MKPDLVSTDAVTEEDCPFCKIARAEDRDVEIVCEGDAWVAFLPPEPATRGHTLVIPRTHAPDLWSIDPELGGALMEAVVRVGHAITTALSPQGMNLITSSGEAAEQTVFHVHLHVVPRWEDDEIDEIWPAKRPMKKSIHEGVARAIRQACAKT